MADINIPPDGQSGKYFDIYFLYSGGFWLSGYNDDTLWVCAQSTASRLEDFIAGNVDSNQYDPRYDVYSVKNFGQINYTEWNRYKFAVDNGADYYDGDGNGIYDPIDFNNNNGWDPNEDKPDFLGIDSQTAWCVFNDGVPSSERASGFRENIPLGIEIQQSVFGFPPYNAPQLKNVLFIRYKIINTGKVNSFLDSVYFSAWADADLGLVYYNDLVGCDTLLESEYIYNSNYVRFDTSYVPENISFFITLLQGPQSYIPGKTFIDANSNGIYDEGVDTPVDTAYNRRGQDLGIENFPGAKNINMSSSTNYIKSDPYYGDPDNTFQARNYMIGRQTNGNLIDPCNYLLGEVRGGVICTEVNPLYWFSGDPVTDVGWIDTLDTDQRMLVNTGPFNLEVGKPITIIAAYIIGEGINRLDGITKAREIAAFTHQFYQSNFNDNLVSVEDEIANVPTEYILYQNYPNPFNPSTIISWQSPVSSHQTLKVYDVLGNEVATLVDEYKPAGNYSVEFNASQLASGIYFYTLRSGSYLETRKMLLLR